MEKAKDIEVYGSHPAHVAVADTYVRAFVTEGPASIINIVQGSKTPDIRAHINR